MDQRVIECPDCREQVAVHTAGPDEKGPVRVVLAKHFEKDGRECAASELVYAEGEGPVAAALRSASG